MLFERKHLIMPTGENGQGLFGLKNKLHFMSYFQTASH
jgi:hypothetical protein